jgi:5-methylcytosine-specific restriction endonuclease McrA
VDEARSGVVTCGFCGREARRVSQRQLYCSRRCKGRAKERRKRVRARKPLVSRVCPECGARFDTNRARQEFCTKRCGDLSRTRVRDRARVYPSTARPPVERVCERCGAAFQAAGIAINLRRFCSRRCARLSRPTTPGAGAHGGHRRRADEYGCEYKTGLSWRLLLAEDGPACWLCGEDVDPADKRLSGRSWTVGVRHPSVDHVVPLARGGHHVRSNVRLAHMGCNSARGAGRGAEVLTAA